LGSGKASLNRITLHLARFSSASSVEQGKKVGLAVAASGDQLTVDDAGFCREPKDGRGDRWEPARKVAPIPAVDRRGEASFVQLHAVPIKFQFRDPAFAGWWRRSQFRQCGRDELNA
jgi:hypothetical protein